MAEEKRVCINVRDCVSTFTYWVIQQHPNYAPDISKATADFSEWVKNIFKEKNADKSRDETFPEQMEYYLMTSEMELHEIITEDSLGSIPSIKVFNENDFELEDEAYPEGGMSFIDLSALARNMVQMITKEAE